MDIKLINVYKNIIVPSRSYDNGSRLHRDIITMLNNNKIHNRLVDDINDSGDKNTIDITV